MAVILHRIYGRSCFVDGKLEGWSRTRKNDRDERLGRWKIFGGFLLEVFLLERFDIKLL